MARCFALVDVFTMAEAMEKSDKNKDNLL